MKQFDANTYKEGKSDFNNQDEDLLISLLQVDQNKQDILDVGCGDGKLTKRIKLLFPESQITAIDNSQDQLDLVGGEMKGVTFQLADITNYDSEMKFDCAYSFYAFPHIPKSKLFDSLCSVKKLLKSGGSFYLFTNICLFNTEAVNSDDQEACDVIFLNNWASQISLVGMSEMEKLIYKAGFKIIQANRLTTGAKVKNYGDMISWVLVLR